MITLICLLLSVSGATPPVAVPKQYNVPANLTGYAFAAGRSNQLDGTSSTSSAMPSTLTYFWQQIAGPSTVQFSSRTVSQPTITGLVFGQYTFRLTVIDVNGEKGNADLTVGAVAQDSNHVVVSDDPKRDKIFGPLIAYGYSEWPAIDHYQVAFADTLASIAPISSGAEWDTNRVGTITLTNGSATITGSGTNFQTDFCSGGTSPVAHYLMVIKSVNAGWRWGQIASCDSATQITLSVGGSGNWPFTTESGMSYARVTDENCWTGGSDNCNYYDNVIGYYSLYYRSGLTSYKTYADTLASQWINNPSLVQSADASNHWPGNMNPPARTIGLVGLAWYAYATNSGAWTQLRTLAANCCGDITDSATLYDIREQGYAVLFQAAMAILDPSPPSPSWATNVTDAITNRWSPQQLTSGPGDGSWVNESAGNFSTEAGISLVNGSSTVTASGATGGFNPQTGGMLSILGETGGYCVSGNYTGGASGTFQINPSYGGTTHSISAGSGYAINSGLAGIGNQPFMIGLLGKVWSVGYAATGSSTAKQFLADIAAYLSATGYRSTTRGLFYARVFPACEPEATAEIAQCNCTVAAGASSSLQTTKQNDRYLAAETIGAMTGAYLAWADAGVKTFGDEIVSALYGEFGGTGSDSDSFPFQEDVTGQKHKTFGFGWGIGSAPSWPAARLGGVAAANNVNYPYSLALPTGTHSTVTKAVVTIQQPNGVETDYTCSSFPCTITYDARQGGHRRWHTYQNSGSQVLLRSDPEVVQ